MARLTDKQKAFVDEYLIDLNATQAAIRAGYSLKTADRIGNENLKKLVVQEYLQERMKDREKRTEVTQDKVLQELAKIAFADRTDFAQVAKEPLIIEGNFIRDPETGDPVMIDVVKLTPTAELSPDKRAVISGIKQGKNGIEVSSYDKTRALELIGKHLGMFTDKVEHSGDLALKVVVDYGEDE